MGPQNILFLYFTEQRQTVLQAAAGLEAPALSFGDVFSEMCVFRYRHAFL